MGEVVLIHGNL